jgi:hypothetical protein
MSGGDAGHETTREKPSEMPQFAQQKKYKSSSALAMIPIWTRAHTLGQSHVDSTMAEEKKKELEFITPQFKGDMEKHLKQLMNKFEDQTNLAEKNRKENEVPLIECNTALPPTITNSSLSSDERTTDRR